MSLLLALAHLISPARAELDPQTVASISEAGRVVGYMYAAAPSGACRSTEYFWLDASYVYPSARNGVKADFAFLSDRDPGVDGFVRIASGYLPAGHLVTVDITETSADCR